MYADNDERAIFFAKGVVETVKNWIGFQISFMCMVGWQLCYQYTSITIKNEALFSDTKIVTSVYSQSLREDAEMINKIKLTEFL
jgi:starch synthase